MVRKEILLTLLKAKLKKETNKITAKFLKSMIEYEELEKNKDTSYHLSSVFFSELA